jgi:hydroxymethylbilane synthase
MSHFVVGTRGSALARFQTDLVNAQVLAAQAAAGAEAPVIDVRVITTQGDVNLAERLAGKLEKGFFTAELESELLGARIDWAVHSLKDLPTRLTDGLALAAVLARHAPYDLLIAAPHAVDVAVDARATLPLRAGMRVGTSSLRRDAMLRAFAGHVQSLPLRGNVPTRVEKLRGGHYDAIVLAAAGVDRLGLDLSGLHVFVLDPHRFQPAPGQGSIAVEARANDARVAALMRPLDDDAARRACLRERDFLRVLEGGCSTPFGCYVDGDRAHLGVEHEGRWCSMALTLPSSSGPVDEDFVRDALHELQRRDRQAQETNHDEPLWTRRV